MVVKWLNDNDPRPTDEPLMALVSSDGDYAYASLLDDGFEHIILLRTITGSDSDLDKYYRIIFDGNGADWTFVCPQNYKNISNKEYRIKRFYDDGYQAIRLFLQEVGYPDKIDIPRRYRRHLDYINTGGNILCRTLR